MKEKQFFLGIDISKSRLLVTLLNESEDLYVGKFRNQLSGFRQMTATLTKILNEECKDYHIYVGITATGTYYLKLASYLYDKEEKLTPCVIGNDQVKKYELNSEINFEKDYRDSAILAICVREDFKNNELKTWFPDRHNSKQLGELIEHWEHLLEMKKISDESMNETEKEPDYSLEAFAIQYDHSMFISKQIKQLEKVIKENIAHGVFPESREAMEKLKSMTGV